MRSLSLAARLLEACTSAAAAAPILESLGFSGELIPLGGEHQNRLNVDSAFTVHLARGKGALRALVVESNGREVRETASTVARRLSARAPQFLWLLIVLDSPGSSLAVAAVDGGRARARIAALTVFRERIVDSDCETLCALAAAKTESDVLTHCRWLEILGRESVSRQFFRALDQRVGNLAAALRPAVDTKDAFELSLLCVSRLLFLSFLETRGWLDRDHCFLANRFGDCMATGGEYHRRVLSPLFFGTLNTAPVNRAPRARSFGRIPFLNGGLFCRSALEARTRRAFFPDEALGDLFGELLSRYRFTAREDSTKWSEAAIDPEMLGKAFESLMSAQERKRTGAFYTPQSLVRDVTKAALQESLSSPSLKDVDELTVLDPACGSGAFLVYVLGELAALRAALGDEQPPHRIRRRILTRSLFGVDVNPTAVWLCELRLWLAMAIEDPETDPARVVPLPNLDRNIRVGDSLRGEHFGHRLPGTARRIAALRSRYARATGPRKRSLAKALDTAERGAALAAAAARVARLRHERRDLLAIVRSPDLFGERVHPVREMSERLAGVRVSLREATAELRRLRSGGALPFSFTSGFSDIAQAGGFGAVIGNPPWVRTHHFDAASRSWLRSAFEVYRDSAWRAGSDAAAAGRGFASQVDLSALFIERSIRLLRPHGTAALIVPAKLWRSLAGGGTRAFLCERAQLRELHDLGSGNRTFEAAVYPSIVIARRRGDDAGRTAPIRIVAHRDGQRREWTRDARSLALDDSRGSPWLLVPADVRAAFDRMIGAGIPLARGIAGRPLLGVKTGCNDAFIVSTRESGSRESLVEISSGERAGLIERDMLRPVIRGESVTPWTSDGPDSFIVWTHDAERRPLPSLPPAALQWLGQWRYDLERRSDGRRAARWWSLFRTESADCSRPRVIWPDIGRSPRAAVLPKDDPAVPLNTCYALRCPTLDDAQALAALINSDLAAAWLDVIAEPARGGYKRYMGWTMALLPMPREWPRARTLLAPFTARAEEGILPDPDTLRRAVLDAFRLSERRVLPLIEWSR